MSPRAHVVNSCSQLGDSCGRLWNLQGGGACLGVLIIGRLLQLRPVSGSRAALLFLGYNHGNSFAKTLLPPRTKLLCHAFCNDGPSWIFSPLRCSCQVFCLPQRVYGARGQNGLVLLPGSSVESWRDVQHYRTISTSTVYFLI